MFARITRVAADPSQIDEHVAMFESDIAPRVAQLPGFLGIGLLVDRESGRRASVSYWEDAEAMRASEAVVGGVRGDTIREGGRLLDIQRYEIVIAERSGPASANVFVRTNTVDVAPGQFEDLIRFVRDEVVPHASAQPGFRALLMGVDRDSNTSSVSTIWQTAADREASEAAARLERHDASHAAGVTEPRVEYYEVLFLHMRAPTLAA